jgi:hypothetical protein
MLTEVLGWYGQNSTDCWVALLKPSKHLLSSALEDSSVEIGLGALEIVRNLWDWAPPDVGDPAERKALGLWKAELHECCVEMLHAPDDRHRAATGLTVVSVPIDSAAKKGLVLLGDRSPYVRRALLLALSERPELLENDDVLAFLSDPDARVRAAADLVLSCRGLTREEISLATRATNPSPLVRAQVPRQIVDSQVVDRMVWLDHLSRDPATEVRSEAARALAQVNTPESLARLAEMAEADSDAGVRELARGLGGRSPSSLKATVAADGAATVESAPILRSPAAN